MKKLLPILPLLAFCLSAQVQLQNARLSNFQVTVTGGNVTPVKKDEQVTDNDYQNIAEDSTMQWASGSWVAGSSYTMTSARIKLAKADSSGTVKLHIFTGDASKLPTGAELAASTTVNCADLPAFPGDYVTFALFGTASISSNSTYCLVIEDSNNDGTTRARVRVNTSAVGYTFGKSANGSSWSSYSAASWVFETWGY